MPDLLEAVTLGAATGNMPRLPAGPPGVDVIEQAWSLTGDPVEIADLAGVTLLVTGVAPRELIHELLWAYSAHFPDYERALIQHAVQLDQQGRASARDVQTLRAHLDDAVGAHSLSLVAIPLHVASSLFGPEHLGGPASWLRTLAGLEGSPAYPFLQRYIADLVHARLPPVTTEMVFGAAVAAQRAGGRASPRPRAPARSSAMEAMRQNPTGKRRRR